MILQPCSSGGVPCAVVVRYTARVCSRIYDLAYLCLSVSLFNLITMLHTHTTFSSPGLWDRSQLSDFSSPLQAYQDTTSLGSVSISPPFYSSTRRLGGPVQRRTPEGSDRNMSHLEHDPHLENRPLDNSVFVMEMELKALSYANLLSLF